MQVRDALSATLPPYLAMGEVETEAIPTAPDQAKVNVKVVISPKETLYAPDRRVPGDPSILLIKPVQVAGGKVTLYGFVQAQRTLDRWTLAAPVFPDGFEALGRPRSAFGAECFVTNSPEANRRHQGPQRPRRRAGAPNAGAPGKRAPKLNRLRPSKPSVRSRPSRTGSCAPRHRAPATWVR